VNPSANVGVLHIRAKRLNSGITLLKGSRFRSGFQPIHERFRPHWVYWSPEGAPDSQNLLIYILEHPNRQEAEKNWAAFQADPEWQKVKAESEANGKLVDHIDHYFMDPTSFSALKQPRSADGVRS
jgi:hypothetical protein